jgi:hypothetical protein
MGQTVFPVPVASGGKTMYRTTLLSGTSYTVPAGVTYLNVTLMGGGGGAAGGGGSAAQASPGLSGQVVSSIVTTTPGASITYAIGAGGGGGNPSAGGSAGGTTTFTGATSASGGTQGRYNANLNTDSAQAGTYATNGGIVVPITGTGLSGGAGSIVIEYWA